MYKCNDCGWQGEPVNHNNRGNRCPQCWSNNLTEVQDKPAAPKPEQSPPKQGRKPVAK